jgi:hypothetical protein
MYIRILATNKPKKRVLVSCLLRYPADMSPTGERIDMGNNLKTTRYHYMGQGGSQLIWEL